MLTIRKFVSGVTIVSAAAMSALAQQAAPVYEPVGWTSEPVLVFSSPRDHVLGHDDGVGEHPDVYMNTREPVVIKTNSGRLVCGVQAGNWHRWPERSGQDFVVRTSDDGGRSWGSPRVVSEHGNGSVQSHGMVYDAEQDRIIVLHTVFCFDFSKVEGRGQGYVAPLERAMLERGDDLQNQFMVTSDDGGDTWSEPIDISAQMPRREGYTVYGHFGASEGRQVTLGEHVGRLLVPGGAWLYDDQMNHAGKLVGVWYSDDHGETWQFSEILQTTNIRNFSCEARVTELPDGTLLFNERTRSTGRQAARSTDGGATWTQLSRVADMDVTQCNGSMLTLRNAEGDLTRTVLLSVPSAAGGRRNSYLYVSTDGGATWPTCHHIMPGFFAYSALVQIDADTVGMFWESGGHQNIHYVQMPISKLLAED